MNNALQYKLASQQCSSEMYHHQISYPLSNQNYISNNQHEMFDNLLNPGFENLDALDPKDDIEDLQSISNIPIIRN